MMSLSVLVAMSVSVLMHPVHETVCEVQWNAETRRVEVALRVDLLDEQWIVKRFKTGEAGVDVDSDWQLRFLRTQIQFDPVSHTAGDGPPSGRPIRWIGRGEDGGHAWWFFEVLCKDGKPPNSVQTRLLFDRDPGYRHHIVVLGDSTEGDAKHPTVVLTEEKPKATLRFR
jgi:hypothetical protein